MDADAKRRAELRAAAIAVAFFILSAVAALHPSARAGRSPDDDAAAAAQFR